ncbi:MAG: DUF2312 domain-containing protein [Pseudomonadota bacterium]
MSDMKLPDQGTVKRLRSFIQRLEHLEDEKKDIAHHVKDVFDEAKSEGYDTKALRQVLQLRKMRPEVREELENLTELYMNAVS